MVAVLLVLMRGDQKASVMWTSWKGTTLSAAFVSADAVDDKVATKQIAAHVRSVSFVFRMGRCSVSLVISPPHSGASALAGQGGSFACCGTADAPRALRRRRSLLDAPSFPARPGRRPRGH